MKKKIMTALVALLVVGAGVFYAVGSGAVQLGAPSEVQATASASAEHQKEIEALRQQVEVLTDALQESSNASSSVPPTPPQASSITELPVPMYEGVPPVAVPVSQTSSVAPPAAPAKKENAGTVFEGYTVTVMDKTTLAVRAAGTGWPITKYNFVSQGGNYLGSISGKAMNAMIERHQTAAGDAPGGGEWEFWFAEQFNEYRGLTNGGSVASSNIGSGQGTGSTTEEVDTTAYAYEVITLTNKERERVGLPALETKGTLMDLSEIRAEELSEKFSHVRPDGVRISELGYGENISKDRNSPTAVVNAWMNSEGHKTNILYEKYQNIGVGCFIKDGTYYWVQLFSWDADSNKNGTGGKTANENGATTASYSINATEVSLSAGETYQLSVGSSAVVDNIRVEWSASKLSDAILSVDGDGLITTYQRSGMSSAKATITVTAKVYVSDKLAKTLKCKVTVTQ